MTLCDNGVLTYHPSLHVSTGWVGSRVGLSRVPRCCSALGAATMAGRDCGRLIADGSSGLCPMQELSVGHLQGSIFSRPGSYQGLEETPCLCSVLPWWKHALCRITPGSCSSLLFACSVHPNRAHPAAREPLAAMSDGAIWVCNNFPGC